MKSKKEKEIGFVKPTPPNYKVDYSAPRLSRVEEEALFGGKEKPKKTSVKKAN